MAGGPTVSPITAASATAASVRAATCERARGALTTDELIAALSDPRAYPHEVERVEVIQTHISVVFRAGPFVYKVKKPLDLGFLNFTSLEQRLHYCREEVRLNGPLAPGVYRGVVPIVRLGERLLVAGEGEPIEYAVKMRRLPDESTLEVCVQRGGATVEMVAALARRLAQFHARAARSTTISEYGRWEVVAGNCRENFEQTRAHVDATVHAEVHERVRQLTEEQLERHRLLIELRAKSQATCDTHGDLRLKHVYLFPANEPPGDVVIVDCIEFNQRFRYADPVADLAFLFMDCLVHGRRDLATQLADAYFAETDDKGGRELLPLYTSYRAVVRAKVEGIAVTEAEVAADERLRARSTARAHWMLALSTLAPPGDRPCLLITAGLPGAGKSTLARTLAERANLEVIRTDVARAELAERGPVSEGELFTSGMNDRTYDECLRRAEQLLFSGRRVIVDANFREERRRLAFLEAARRWCVPFVIIHCEAPLELVKARLEQRKDDASRADWTVRQRVAEEWEEFGESTQAHAHSPPPSSPLDSALAVLRGLGLS